MFKKGDRIRCVNNYEVEAVLTIGKEYIINSAYNIYIRVLNDNNYVQGYYQKRFILKTNEEYCRIIGIK